MEKQLECPMCGNKDMKELQKDDEASWWTGEECWVCLVCEKGFTEGEGFEEEECL